MQSSIAIDDITARRDKEDEQKRYCKNLEKLIKELTAELVEAVTDHKKEQLALIGKVNSSGVARITELEATIHELEKKISKFREQLKEIRGDKTQRV